MAPMRLAGIIKELRKLEFIGMEKKFSVIGIIVCVLYFLSVGLFLVTGTSPALTVWELMTVISGPVVLLTLLGFARYLSIPDIQDDEKERPILGTGNDFKKL